MLEVHRLQILSLLADLQAGQCIDDIYTAKKEDDGPWVLLPSSDLPLPDLPVGISKTGSLFAIPTLPQPPMKQTMVVRNSFSSKHRCSGIAPLLSRSLLSIHLSLSVFFVCVQNKLVGLTPSEVRQGRHGQAYCVRFRLS